MDGDSSQNHQPLSAITRKNKLLFADFDDESMESDDQCLAGEDQIKIDKIAQFRARRLAVDNSGHHRYGFLRNFQANLKKMEF